MNFGGLVDIPDKSNFDSHTFGVRLSPDEPSIFDLHLAESLDLFQQDGQQFSTLPLTVDPRRSLVSEAVSTEELLIIGAEKVFRVNGGQSTSGTYVRCSGCEF